MKIRIAKSCIDSTCLIVAAASTIWLDKYCYRFRMYKEKEKKSEARCCYGDGVWRALPRTEFRVYRRRTGSGMAAGEAGLFGLSVPSDDSIDNVRLNAARTSGACSDSSSCMDARR